MTLPKYITVKLTNTQKILFDDFLKKEEKRKTFAKKLGLKELISLRDGIKTGLSSLEDKYDTKLLYLGFGLSYPGAATFNSYIGQVTTSCKKTNKNLFDNAQKLQRRFKDGKEEILFVIYDRGKFVSTFTNESKTCKTAAENYNTAFKFLKNNKDINALSIAKQQQIAKEYDDVIFDKQKTIKPPDDETKDTIDDPSLGTATFVELTQAEINSQVEGFKKSYKEGEQKLKDKPINELLILEADIKKEKSKKESIREERDQYKIQFTDAENKINNLESQLKSKTGSELKILKSDIATAKQGKDSIANTLNQTKYVQSDVNVEIEKHKLKVVSNIISVKKANNQLKTKTKGKKEPLKTEDVTESTKIKCQRDSDCPADLPLCNAGVCSKVDDESAKTKVEKEFQEKLEFDLETVRLAAANLKPKNRIFGIKNYDLSRLRFVDNLDRYLEDPIAFITNNVWNYNFPSTDVATFNFIASTSILNNINEKTEELVKKSLFTVLEDKVGQINTLSGGDLTTYNILTDYFFIEDFSSRVRKYLEELYSKADLSVFEVEKENIFTNVNIRFFWFWINQLFVKNVKLFERDDDGNGQLKITLNAKTYVPVAIAFYFLMIQKKFLLRDPDSDDVTDNVNIDINISKLYYDRLLPQRKSGVYTFNLVLPVKSFFDTLSSPSKFFTNDSNYINLNSIPEIQYGTVVQIRNSPFFAAQQKLLNSGEKVSISNVKKLKKCKNVSDAKDETGLRLFYKEGNDNILDKNVPEGGLGCDTPVEDWSTAENIVFNGSSILSTNNRVNYTLPYYNVVRVKSRGLVPNELNILKTSLDTQNKKDNKNNTNNIEKLLLQYRSFTGQILLDLIEKAESDVLIDNSLLEDIEKNRGATGKILSSFFNKDSQAWGADKPLVNNREFQEEKFIEIPFAPYVGVFPVGYQVEKTNVAGNELIQRFLTNTISKTAVNNEASLENSVFEISDSQVKYATGYKYFLSSILSMSVIQYQYQNVEFTQPAVGNPKELKNKVESLQKELDKVLEDKKSASFTKLPGLLIKETKLKLELASLKIKTAYSLEATGDEQPIFVKFKTGNIKYLNDIEEVQTSDITVPISYVDLPPNPLFMQVYPKRGVNNKILLSFKGYSLENKIQTVKIPKKYWTDGWEDSKEFFVKSFKNFSDDTLKKFGIEDDIVEEDEMFFTEQPIEKIRLYFLEGKKPKDFLDLQEFPVKIDALNEGFTKEIDLKPNTKYYFSAKAESFTGLLSEFSQVYEIELVDDGGAVFPVVNVVDFSDNNKRERKISFGDRFRIQPAILQQAPNPTKDDVGYLNPSVFTNISETRPQFKVRLTSKKTGKKVDFNIIYKKDFVKDSKQIAGAISLENALKQNVLISYTNKPKPPPTREAPTFSPVKVLDDAVGVPTRQAPSLQAPTREAPSLQAPTREAPSLQAPTRQASSLKPISICCYYDDKAPLFPTFSPAGKKTWDSPSLSQDVLSSESVFGELNTKLSSINDALKTKQKDVNGIKNIIDNMLLQEKCYLCKRKEEYVDDEGNGISILGLILQLFPVGENLATILNSLNCKQFGFANQRGGDPKGNNGESLNKGESNKKCGTVRLTKIVVEGKGGKGTKVVNKNYSN